MVILELISAPSFVKYIEDYSFVLYNEYRFSCTVESLSFGEHEISRHNQ